jgi:hypothetical protein
MLHDGNVWRWATSGDGNPRHHVQGTGSLLLAGVALAAAGLAVTARRRATDPFWIFVLLGAGASLVPDAVTVERIHSLRAIGLPVFLVALAVPAIDFLAARSAALGWRAVAAVLFAAGAAQFTLFQIDYARDGPKRVAAFQAGFPEILRSAAATGRPVVVYLNDYEALGNAQWYARLWAIRVSYLPFGEFTPHGSVLVSGLGPCEGCRIIRRSGVFSASVRT